MMENADMTSAISATLTIRPGVLAPGPSVTQLPAMPWRDPHSVPPEKLAEVIAALNEACALNPSNAELRICLGMAHAMNCDPYRSMDALEEARVLAPQNFLAQFKYAELFFRLRALERAQQETSSALELAGNAWELSQARHQLSEIRRLLREGTQKPTWTKSLTVPVISLGLMLAVVSIIFMAFR
jgi:tetratricopeptide (TPR) repeat protein